MPVITKIAVAKRNKGRFHIYLEKGAGEEYGFTVSEDVLVRRHLGRGVTLTEAEVEEIKEEDILDKAFQKTLNFLSYRMRSEKEVFTYLRELEVGKDDALQLIDRLADLNLLNDEMFAEAFVRTKKNTQKKGPLIIEQELYEKGITQQIIDKALWEYPPEEQLENAILAARKKRNSYKTEANRQMKQKLYQFLIQRGFTAETSQEAVQICLDEMADEAEDLEWEAVKKQGVKALKKAAKLEGWEREQKMKQFLYQRGFTMDIIDRWLKEEAEIEE